MRNLLMLAIAVLGTSVMVNAFPAKTTKAAATKEVTMKKHHKHNKAKKAQKVTTPAASSTPAK